MRPLFAYNGYISAYPQILAYLFSHAPFSLQFFLYLFAPAIVTYLMTIQAYQLLRLDFGRTGSLLLTFLILLVLHRIEPRIFSNLTYSIWLALIGCCLFLTRLCRSQIPATAWGLLLIFLVSLSHALSIILLPIAMVMATFSDTKGRRVHLPLALVVSSSIISMFALSQWSGSEVGGAWTINPFPLLTHYAHHFLDGSFKGNLSVLVSIIVLGAGAGYSLFFTKTGEWTIRERLEPMILPYFGFGSLALYVISPRFLSDAGFAPRYVLLSTTCAILVLAVQVRPFMVTDLKSRLKIALYSVAIMSILTLFVSDFGRSPIESVEHKMELYGYMSTIQGFREACSNGEYRGFSGQYRLPVVFCRAEILQPGMSRITFEEPYFGGDLPEVIIGRPNEPQIYGGKPIP